MRGCRARGQIEGPHIRGLLAGIDVQSLLHEGPKLADRLAMQARCLASRPVPVDGPRSQRSRAMKCAGAGLASRTTELARASDEILTHADDGIACP